MATVDEKTCNLVQANCASRFDRIGHRFDEIYPQLDRPPYWYATMQQVVFGILSFIIGCLLTYIKVYAN